MARTPSQTDRKAEGYAMLAGGATLDEVVERTGTAKSTVQGWAAKVKEITGKAPAEIRANNFDEKVQDAACALMDAIRAQAELAGDRGWLMGLLTAPSEGVNNVNSFTKAVTERLTVIVQFAQGVAPERLPANEPSALEAELVDA